MKRSDAVLPAMPRVAHARANNWLQVEGEPVFGAAGDVVEVENGPSTGTTRSGGVCLASVAVRMPPPGLSGPTSSPMTWVPKT